jgi:hypothetical protein
LRLSAQALLWVKAELRKPRLRLNDVLHAGGLLSGDVKAVHNQCREDSCRNDSKENSRSFANVLAELKRRDAD